MSKAISLPTVGTVIKSSTGGTITYTKTGLIHTCGKNYNSTNVGIDDKRKVK